MDTTDKIAPNRRIGLRSLVNYYIGVIIGAGIFISPRGILQSCGSVGLSLIFWVLIGVIAIIGALAEAEIALVFGKSGGQYTYFLHVFGPVAGFVQCFLYNLFDAPASLATRSTAIAEYLLAALSLDCHQHTLAVPLLATCILWTGCFIAMRSITVGKKLQEVVNFIKLGLLLVIIIFGFVRLGQGHTQHLDNGWEGTTTNIGGLVMAFYYGMYSYAGWSVTFIEEIKDPKRDITVGAIFSLTVAIIVYLLVNISYFTVLSPQQLLEAPAVGYSWAAVTLPGVPWLLPLVVAISVFASLYSSTFKASREVFAQGREGHVPNIFGMLHCDYLTPTPAVFLMLIMGTVMIILGGNSLTLLLWGYFIDWIQDGFVYVAIIYMRYSSKWKHVKRPYKPPIAFSMIMVSICFAITVLSVARDPQWAYFYVFLLMIIALILYAICIKGKRSISAKITHTLQIIFNVVPAAVPVIDLTRSD